MEHSADTEYPGVFLSQSANNWLQVCKCFFIPIQRKQSLSQGLMGPYFPIDLGAGLTQDSPGKHLKANYNIPCPYSPTHMPPCVSGVKKKKNGNASCSIYKTQHSHKGWRLEPYQLKFSKQVPSLVWIYTSLFSACNQSSLSLQLLSLEFIRQGLAHGKQFGCRV